MVCQINCDGVDFSLLQPTQFQLIFDKIDCVTFFIHRIALPDLSMNFALAATPYHDIHLPGEKIVYSNLVVDVLVDKQMTTYKTLHNWMRKISMHDGISTDDVSNAKLIIAENVEFEFTGVFPLNISSINMQSNVTDTDPITFSATFNVVDFNIK